MNGAPVRDKLFTSVEALIEKDQADRAAAPREAPVFEIRIMSRLAGTNEPLHHIKIWADGYVEGLGKIAGRAPVLIENRFPMLLDQVLQPFKEVIQETESAIEALSAPPNPDAVREGEPG
jgi:hypothetical protein